MASQELMSEKEKRIQKALGTLPMKICAQCKRKVSKDEIQYIIMAARHMYDMYDVRGVCKLCRRLSI